MRATRERLPSRQPHELAAARPLVVVGPVNTVTWRPALPPLDAA